MVWIHVLQIKWMKYVPIKNIIKKLQKYISIVKYKTNLNISMTLNVLM